MSGIVGYYMLDTQPASGEFLAYMLDAIVHRGSDDSGAWYQDSTALGHRMLWTTPESLKEKQPFHSDDRVITADARLDNRDDLLHRLDFGGRKPGDVTDSQIILAAYEKWGTECARNLIGDFAFAIWDGTRKAFFCARDSVGVKPFYYACVPGRVFAFASEIKALLALPDVPCELNETRIADYIEVNYEDRVSTFYKYIFRLPAAHWLEIAPDKLTVEQYWSLDPERELRLSSDDEYAEGFLELFTRSVRSRLRSTRPTGASLSGGLDSSSIVCLARNLIRDEGREPLHTFSLIFPSLPEPDRARADERPYMEKVLAGGDLQAHFVHGDEHTPLGHTSDLLTVLDEPSIGPNLFINWGICQAAHEAGVRVLLDGFGGDSVISHGTAYLTELAYKGAWNSFSEEARALASRYRRPPHRYLETYGIPSLSALAESGQWQAFLQGVLGVVRHSPVPRTDLIRNYGLKPIKVNVRRLRKRASAKPTNGTALSAYSSLLEPGFAQRTGYYEQQRSSEKPFYSLRAGQYSALNYAFTPVGLEEANKLAASFSIDITFPYFDRPLMEFCLSLPGDQKLKHGWGRMYMRRAMKDILPEEIRWRSTKGDFGPNFTRGFSQFDRPMVEQIMRDVGTSLDGYIGRDTVNQLYSRYMATKNKIDELNLWRVLTLSLWLSRFQANGRQPVSLQRG